VQTKRKRECVTINTFGSYVGGRENMGIYLLGKSHERGKKPPEHDTEYEGERIVNTLVGLGMGGVFFCC
jgi:hypothetical protein